MSKQRMETLGVLSNMRVSKTDGFFYASFATASRGEINAFKAALEHECPTAITTDNTNGNAIELGFNTAALRSSHSMMARNTLFALDTMAKLQVA